MEQKNTLYCQFKKLKNEITPSLPQKDNYDFTDYTIN